ncbi:MAG: AzlD domain-containing protein [Treponema sp.]|nr:AzlD domain-containing protein [Treponema sp.]
MKIDSGEALLLTVVMAIVIFFCRAFPFLFFIGKKQGHKTEAFIGFIEKVVPPLAMTVLALNAISSVIYENIKQDNFWQGGFALAAAAVTVILHLWRRNILLSIFCGTAVYMAFNSMYVHL